MTGPALAYPRTALTPFGQALRKWALRHSDVVEGVACEGTAIEKRTIKRNNKAFLFLGTADAMLKLRESVPEAKKLAAKQPAQFRAGATGWITTKFGESEPPVATMKKWIDESYRTVANGQTVSKTTRKKATS
jgi:hypothetical protein